MRTNAHRSLLLGALALFVLAAPASAAEVARIDGARLDARDDRGSDFCLRLTTGDGFGGGGSGTCGPAPVRPRRSLLTAWVAGDELFTAGAVPASVTRAEAELSDGRRVARAVLRGGRVLRARVVRIPRRFGGGRAWVLALPRGARVKALRFDGTRATFPLLPAARQCGYSVYAPGLADGSLAP